MFRGERRLPEESKRTGRERPGGGSDEGKTLQQRRRGDGGRNFEEERDAKV